MTADEVVVASTSIILWSAMLAVGVASYRRGRYLRGQDVFPSVVYAVVAGSFPYVWASHSLVHRDRLRAEWAAYKAELVAVADESASQ